MLSAASSYPCSSLPPWRPPSSSPSSFSHPFCDWLERVASFIYARFHLGAGSKWTCCYNLIINAIDSCQAKGSIGIVPLLNWRYGWKATRLPIAGPPSDPAADSRIIQSSFSLVLNAQFQPCSAARSILRPPLKIKSVPIDWLSIPSTLSAHIQAGISSASALISVAETEIEPGWVAPVSSGPLTSSKLSYLSSSSERHVWFLLITFLSGAQCGRVCILSDHFDGIGVADWEWNGSALILDSLAYKALVQSSPSRTPSSSSSSLSLSLSFQRDFR